MLQFIFPKRVYLWYLESLFVVFIIGWILTKYTNYFLRIIIGIVLLVVGITFDRKFGDYVLFGNPLKYILWFEVGTCFIAIRQILKKYKLWSFFIALSLMLIHIVLFLWSPTNKYFNIALNHFGFPLVMIFSLMIICEIWGNKLSEKSKEKIKIVSSYSYGVYLYAEPINYIILYLFVNIGGINILWQEIPSITLACIRIFATTIIAIFIVYLLRKFKLKYLY